MPEYEVKANFREERPVWIRVEAGSKEEAEEKVREKDYCDLDAHYGDPYENDELVDIEQIVLVSEEEGGSDE